MGSELGVVGAAGWLQLVVGLAVFLLPGLALADRMFPAKHHLVFAPVVSFSILALAGILLDFALGIPITPLATYTLALGIALWAGWPRIRQGWKIISRPHEA